MSSELIRMKFRIFVCVCACVDDEKWSWIELCAMYSNWVQSSYETRLWTVPIFTTLTVVNVVRWNATFTNIWNRIASKFFQIVNIGIIGKPASFVGSIIEEIISLIKTNSPQQCMWRLYLDDFGRHGYVFTNWAITLSQWNDNILHHTHKVHLEAIFAKRYTRIPFLFKIDGVV